VVLPNRYSITVAARDGKIYTVKNGELMESVIQLESQPVGLVTSNKNIIVGCMNDVVHSYKSKGVKNWTLYMPTSILGILQLNVTAARMTKCLIVALVSGKDGGT
jgi:Bardet-Biedl syndrome 1 protein